MSLRAACIDRFGLLGSPYLTHAALADFSDEGIAPGNNTAGPGRRLMIGGHRLLDVRLVGCPAEITRAGTWGLTFSGIDGLARFGWRFVDHAAGLLVCREEGFEGTRNPAATPAAARKAARSSGDLANISGTGILHSWP